jgi:hypothetical protein
MVANQCLPSPSSARWVQASELAIRFLSSSSVMLVPLKKTKPCRLQEKKRRFERGMADEIPNQPRIL